MALLAGFSFAPSGWLLDQTVAVCGASLQDFDGNNLLVLILGALLQRQLEVFVMQMGCRLVVLTR